MTTTNYNIMFTIQRFILKNEDITTTTQRAQLTT